MNIDRLIRRQSPRRGSPDNRVDRLASRRSVTKGLSQLRHIVVKKPEPDIDGRVIAIFILDLGLCERGAAIEAPVDWLQATINIAFLQELSEHADFVSLVARRHREI